MAQRLDADIVKTVGLHQDVRWFGAVLDGVTDDTAAFVAAIAAAGVNGTILVSLGNALVGDVAMLSGMKIAGTGLWSKLTTKAGAAYALTMPSRLNCEVSDLVIDGVAGARSGILIQGDNTAGTSQHQYINRVKFLNCLVGAYIVGTAGVPTSDQVDKNYFNNCEWEGCGTGLWNNSTNAQILSVDAGAFNSNTIGIRLTHGSLIVTSTGWQWNANGQVGIQIDGVNVDSVNLRTCQFEPGAFVNCVPIQGMAGAGESWAIAGVIAEHCTFVDSNINIGRIGGVGTTSTFVARGCRFVNCNPTTAVDEAVFHDEYNSFEMGSAWTLAGAAAVTAHRYQWTYAGYYQYFGANLVGHINQAGDYISNTATNGLVLKAPDGNFWRVLVDNAGALNTTNLGAVMPEN